MPTTRRSSQSGGRAGALSAVSWYVSHGCRERGDHDRAARFADRSEPTTGAQIDSFLKTADSPYVDAEAIHALFAENRRVLDAKLRTDIAAGVTVIADRYSFSGISYTVRSEDCNRLDFIGFLVAGGKRGSENAAGRRVCDGNRPS